MKSNRKQKQKGRWFLRRDGLERVSKEPCVPDWWGEFWQQAEGAKEEGRIKGWSQLAGGPRKNGEGPRHQTDRCGPDWCPAEAGRKKWHEKENRQGEVKKQQQTAAVLSNLWESVQKMSWDEEIKQNIWVLFYLLLSVFEGNKSHKWFSSCSICLHALYKVF